MLVVNKNLIKMESDNANEVVLLLAYTYPGVKY